MILAAINLGLVTILFFLIGMIKPQWALFFLDKPNRMIVLSITVVLVMVSVTMYGEGHRRSTLAQEVTIVKPKIADAAPVPVPVPSAPLAK
ncbi:MAG: hypothetical protein HOP23_03920 [Methylococcaceae bacterium]|nr:hypothetical protein [Methylococcaceae bacterium]